MNSAADLNQVELPSELRVGKFAEARISEILGLQAYIDQPRQGQAVAQQLPRHLRRRAVSHNPNRLPRRLRERHIKERTKSGCHVKGDKKVDKKSSSRKHRRRPRELLQEYNRRQREFVWLETHLWHAKRFHVAARWGYKLAEFPNDKSFRACYRAAAKKCLMQDISFLPCIELRGPESGLLGRLSQLTPAETGVGFARPDVLSGSCEGKTLVYRPGQFPSGVVGQVDFLWRPRDDEMDSLRTLWVWAHPSFYQELKEVVIDLTGAKEVEVEAAPSAEAPPPTKKRKKDVNASKLETRNVPFSKVPRWAGEDGISLSLLKDTLNRFRLVGPMSQSVLSKTLRVSEVAPDESEKSPTWWKEHYSCPEQRRRMEEQKEAWERMVGASPAQVKPGTVLGLTVRDPRVILPGKRGGIEDLSTNGDVLAPHSDVHKSPLWLPRVRDDVTCSKVSDAVINQRRSERLVPGSELQLCEEEARVPVLLIQQPGCPQTGFGAAWDLVLPAGWGMSFWMNLVFQGARVGGLREMKHLWLERGSLDCVPRAPDATSHREERRAEAETLRTVFFSHPPDKRCNFNKIGIVSPFSAPWPILIREFSEENKETSEQLDFFVLRSPSLLVQCDKALKSASSQESSFPSDLAKNALIPVRVDLTGKGNVGANSLVCLPTEEDLEAWVADNHYPGPLEPTHVDANEKARKELHARHQKKKASLRRKWKAEKDKLEELTAQSVLKKEELDQKVVKALKASIAKLREQREEEVKSFNEQMGTLWVGECRGLKGSCSRRILGFVVEGGYSYRVGRCVGLGFVPVPALELYLGVAKERLVLVRETTAEQYRFARLSVVTSDV